MRNSGMVRTIVNLTAPQCSAQGILHNGINISVCENNIWQVGSFLRPSHICILY